MPRKSKSTKRLAPWDQESLRPMDHPKSQPLCFVFCWICWPTNLGERISMMSDQAKVHFDV